MANRQQRPVASVGDGGVEAVSAMLDFSLGIYVIPRAV